MDTHVRNLGLLSIVFGLVSVVGALAVLLYFGTISAVFNFAEDTAGVGFPAVALIVSHLIVGGPFVAGGWFVRRYLNWARFLMIVLCGVSLLLVPFGSLLAIYGLWVLMTPETEPLFSDPPDRLPRHRRHS